MSVYFIQAEDGGPIKIGYSDDPAKRLIELQTSHHSPLVIRSTISGPPSLERKLHTRFRAHRLSGEWFSPVAEIAEMGECIADDAKVKRQRAARAIEADESMAAHLAGILAIASTSHQEGDLTLHETLHLARLIGAPETSRGWSQRPVDDELYMPVLEITIAYLVAIGAPASRIKPLRSRLRSRKQQLSWMRKRSA